MKRLCVDHALFRGASRCTLSLAVVLVSLSVQVTRAVAQTAPASQHDPALPAPTVAPEQPPETPVPVPEEQPSVSSSQMQTPPTAIPPAPPSTTIYAEPPPVYVPSRSASVSEASFLIGSPIWFTPDDGIVEPGVSFEARFARRFGLVAPELTVGWQINWIDEDELPSAARYYNLTIDNLFISLGARLYVLREGPVQPFISAAFDLSFWHLTGNTETVCGYYYCATAAEYDVGIGISGRVGVAFLPNPRLQIELGAKIAMAFAVGPLDEVEAWVTPFLGFTARL